MAILSLRINVKHAKHHAVKSSSARSYGSSGHNIVREIRQHPILQKEISKRAAVLWCKKIKA